MGKYEVNNSSIESILAWIKNGEIAIPEIQRPFVWDNSKVRDLIDSLYNGFPVGYIITWKNPDVKLKDGTFALGKKVLIDGQQRITALTAAIVALEVVGSNYKKKRIKIAFNPKYLIDALRAVDDEKVAVQFNSSLSPCIIKPEEGDSYKYLILPLRM